MSGGICPRGVIVRGYLSGGNCPGGNCPDTVKWQGKWSHNFYISFDSLLVCQNVNNAEN